MHITRSERTKFFIWMIISCLLLTGYAGGCKSAEIIPGETPSAEFNPFGRTDNREPDELSDDDPDYVHTRPRASIRDELMVVFSKGELELDVRKSYYASEAQIFTALYEGLFSYHPFTMEPVAAAASRWETSEDKKQWTFTIRNSARYWNGDQLRAQDFRAAWLSLLDIEDSPYSSLFDIIEGARDYRLGINRDPDKVGISVTNDRTLVVRLNSPAAFFPSMLCHHSFSPIHPTMLNNTDWSKTPVISNGPFYISENSEDRLILLKNVNYWDSSRNSLNKIIIEFTENGDDAAALWNSGAAHWISGDVNIDALSDKSGITVNAMFATHYYFIRSLKPYDDDRVRRALSLVIPWEEIRAGYFLPAKTLIFPIPGYPEIDGIETTDAEEALKLLEEAGYPRGIGLPELVIRITPSMDANRVSRLMAAAWMEKLGIPVKIDVVPFGRYFQMLKGNDYNVGYTTWIGDFADPYTFLQMWRRDSNLNDAQYDSDEYEALMEKSMLEEGQKRWEILAEAEMLLLSQGTVLPISYSPAVNIIDIDEIEGWFPNVLDIHPFKYLGFRSLRPLPGVAMASFSVLD